MLKISPSKNYSNVSLLAKMGKIYCSRYAQIGGTTSFWSGTPTFSSWTFCQMGVLNSCFQNPSESSGVISLPDVTSCDKYEPRHAIMCLREINYVMRYDVVKSDVIISRRA